MSRFSITPRTCFALTLRTAQTSAFPRIVTRTYSSANLPLPTGEENKSSPKVTGIVDQISSLTLLETSELVAQLKSRLHIQDVAMPAMAAAPAGSPAAAPAAEEEKKVEKTEFKVKLEKVDAASKAKMIREIKGINPTMTLVDAKKFVEGVPKIVLENATKEDAEKLKKALEAVGGTVVLE